MRHQSVEAFDPSGHSAGGDTVNFVNVSERFALGKEIFVSAPVKLSRPGVLSEAVLVLDHHAGGGCAHCHY